eukprot:6461855-Amphidinium_carterae.2
MTNFSFLVKTGSVPTSVVWQGLKKSPSARQHHTSRNPGRARHFRCCRYHRHLICALRLYTQHHKNTDVLLDYSNMMLDPKPEFSSWQQVERTFTCNSSWLSA